MKQRKTDYGFFSPTATLACDVGLPGDGSSISQLLQNQSKDDYRLILALDHLRESQVRAIMTIVNALDGCQYTERTLR